jgi:hypothetical protein
MNLSALREDLRIQCDPVAALPALYLSTHAIRSEPRDPVAALPALYLSPHWMLLAYAFEASLKPISHSKGNQQFAVVHVDSNFFRLLIAT